LGGVLESTLGNNVANLSMNALLLLAALFLLESLLQLLRCLCLLDNSDLVTIVDKNGQILV
jgi:hypothetical protein